MNPPGPGKNFNFGNLVLFLSLSYSLNQFGVAAGLFFSDLPGRSSLFGEMFLAAFLLVLILEGLLVRSLEPNPTKAFLTPLLLTHVPWVLGWALPTVVNLTLPDPHNFVLRKIQILFGVMWTAHLFLFAGWLLARVGKEGGVYSRMFGWVALYFLLGLTLWTTQCDLSGDEPHYLLMGYSLLHDGDLDLANNYQNQDYLSFYHRGSLVPQGLDHFENGKIFSYHPLGPVLLVLPVFALLGRLGAALTMALMAALALFLTLKVMEETGAKGWPLQAVAWIGLFSSPVLLFAGLIYPEIPTALLTALALWLFLKKRWGLLGVDLGLMLWMHNRNVLLVIPLLLLLVLETGSLGKERWKAIGRGFGGFLTPTLVLAFYFLKVYGVFTPLGAHHEPFASLFPLSRFFIGFFGLVLDQECGLWFHFPVFALMAAGGILLLKSENPLRRLVLGTFGFFYLFMCFYENLGLTPATRYMVGVTPLLMIMLYPVLEKIPMRGGWFKLTAFLFGVGVAVNGLLSAVPWMRYNRLQGENWILKLLGNALHLPLTQWEPAFHATPIELKSFLIAAVWVVLCLVLTLRFLSEKVSIHTEEELKPKPLPLSNRTPWRPLKILIVTPLVPYPPHDGDKLRLFHFLYYLHKRGHQIDLMCLTRVKEDLGQAQALRPLCRSLYMEHLTDWDLAMNLVGGLLLGRSLNVSSYHSPKLRDVLKAFWASAEGKSVDVVLAHRLRMAPAAFSENPGKPVVLELTDSMIGYTEKLRTLKGAPFTRKLAAKWDYWFLKSEEVDWARRSAQSTVISEQDAKTLLENGAPLDKVQIVPNGVSIGRKVSSKNVAYPKGRPVVCFVGNMGYAPNEEGALWFLKHIWPKVKAHIPNALFAAVGGSPRKKLKKFHDGQNILVTGWVPDVSPYFTQATVSVAPLRVASGMQNKVAQALGLGVPVVATPQAVGWMVAKGKSFVETADGEEAFAQKVVEILKNPRKAKLKAAKGKAYILKTYRWENSGRMLEQILLRAKT